MLLELLRVEVARDEAQLGLGGRAGDPRRMDEPLASLGRLGRAVVLRQPLDDAARASLIAFTIFPFDVPGMDAVPFDPDPHLGGGERLVVDAADLGAVERVREVGAELLDVEVVDAAADLLVDGEADADRRVLDLGMRREVRDRAHDLGDAGLVVGAEQRRAVRRDDVVARRARRGSGSRSARSTLRGSPGSTMSPPS